MYDVILDWWTVLGLHTHFRIPQKWIQLQKYIIHISSSDHMWLGHYFKLCLVILSIESDIKCYGFSHAFHKTTLGHFILAGFLVQPTNYIFRCPLPTYVSAVKINLQFGLLSPFVYMPHWINISMQMSLRLMRSVSQKVGFTILYIHSVFDLCFITQPLAVWWMLGWLEIWQQGRNTYR